MLQSVCNPTEDLWASSKPQERIRSGELMSETAQLPVFWGRLRKNEFLCDLSIFLRIPEIFTVLETPWSTPASTGITSGEML